MITVDGEAVTAYRGETVAGALLAIGRRTLRLTHRAGAPRGIFCGMGVCFECVVTVNGMPYVRSCMTPVTAGMTIETGVQQR